jgi:hypothetical protein
MQWRLVPRKFVLPAFAAAWAATTASGQPPSSTRPPVTTTPQAIQQQQPSFYVHAEVDRKSAEYYAGEQLSLSVVSEADAYLYVIYQQADGETYVVFPNSGQPNNRVPAKQSVRIPAAKDTFRWTVSAPFGKEVMKVIACKQRVDALEKPDVRRKRATPIAAKDLASAGRELLEKLPADQWSEVELDIVTHEGKNPNAAPAANRFGVFFGVSGQDVTPALVEAYGQQADKDLGACVIDATLMEQTLRGPGRLIDTRIFSGKEATRANFEAAVTGWLANTSRPGDTVVIYFSGHGGQIPDDGRDEADGLDEILIPCDVLSVDAVVALREKQRQGTLDAMLAERLDRANRLLAANQLNDLPDAARMKALLARQAAAEPDELRVLVAADTLLRRTSCISDDLFGRWLQALMGRKVIVILDACHAGGFAVVVNGQKKGDEEQQPIQFDFLEKEIGRLKDLGQPDSALLAACRAAEEALNGHARSADASEPAEQALATLFAQLKINLPDNFDPLGLMTYYLVNTLLSGGTPLDVEHTGMSCAAAMKGYFASAAYQELIRKTNEQRTQQGLPEFTPKPHSPVWIDNCRPPALLRP